SSSFLPRLKVEATLSPPPPPSWGLHLLEELQVQRVLQGLAKHWSLTDDLIKLTQRTLRNLSSSVELGEETLNLRSHTAVI
ncbi:uncharacterized, partial [Tachysurus ichikawai]